VKILIAGAGEVGFELAKVLSEEKHDVTVLDERKKCLQRVVESLDVLTIEGNATSPNSLVEAGAKEADLMVAVTNSDEVNIIASMMGKRLGVAKVIARVRNDELSRENSPITPSELGIDMMIHPEVAAANDIFQLVKRASASDVVSLADEQIQLIGLRVEKDSDVLNYTLEELSNMYEGIIFRVVAISRRGTTIIPRGHNSLMAYDHIFVVAKTEDVKTLITATGHSDKKLRRVMIAGGTELGRMIARKLCADKQKWDIKLIEPSHDVATDIAINNRDIMVLHGNPTDPNLLVTEGVQEMDAFISVTEDEESNIISCLMAKHLEVKKTVALVSKSQYVPLSQTIGIDAIVNIKSSATDEIHRQIRQGMLLTVKALQGIKAEIIEVIAGEKSRILNKPIHTLSLPEGVVIGAILRNGDSLIATGDSIIKKNDRVIILALPNAIQQVEKLF
jgi:trk system potassium uptake protein